MFYSRRSKSDVQYLSRSRGHRTRINSEDRILTRRRWIADAWSDTTAELIGSQALHLARVLRAEPGMEYDIVAGGRVFNAKIERVAEANVSFALLCEIESHPALPVTLLLAVFKFDRMEWAIEKATELGVKQIVPVIARRTEKHLAAAAAKRVERWRRIVREAAQQSRRADAPQVHDEISLKTALQISEPRSTIDIVLSEVEQQATLKEVVENAIAIPGPDRTAAPHLRLAIGPEGGWAPEELALFHEAGWQAATLGPQILRTETAAISALAVVAAMLG